MRTFITLLLIVLLGVLVVSAQDNADPFAEREIITVLKMADDVFEPDLWRASAAENTSSTTATWQSTLESGVSGLSFINYLHFDSGYTPERLDEIFNEQWFTDTFTNWEAVRKVNVCFSGDITLHEFTLAFREADGNLARYSLRYWVDPISETRVRAWHIAIATTYADGTPNPAGQTLLDDYSARIYPDLPGCRR